MRVSRMVLSSVPWVLVGLRGLELVDEVAVAADSAFANVAVEVTVVA